ncbi:Oidioi.mRNA.OKI2018_I69.PAR.g9882.t1.cds [Oikopleura dioica]|uniref:Oidioi.mRNA.OKI2018_I69.PAR.g9882.t1.cds n=1 Tax=Oikopleura dioica TaxID=34765 RepID=A0ABN7RRX8_OIKDI|nr:Oidioi.mRNA.OKI2018_I69.PAR.g9882.t1.cds [Oikopleura dioica]
MAIERIISSLKTPPFSAIFLISSFQNPTIGPRAIGCCPAGDPTGKPYFPGQGCCCGELYDESTSFCCELSCKVFESTLKGWTQCNAVEVDYTDHTESYSDYDFTTEPWQPTTVQTTMDPNTNSCRRKMWLPHQMEAACTDFSNHGSQCTFQCPSPYKIKIPDNPNYRCENGDWVGDAPECCMRDGCPANMKMDFIFVIDSSSSIKDKNFNYVREYIIGLIKSLPIGENKTRVGVITFNEYPIFRIKPNDYYSKADLLEAVANIPYEGKGTKTARALDFTVENAFLESVGDRPDVPNTVLVLTDGRANDNDQLPESAARLHNHQQTEAVIVVGVGKRIVKEELNIIANGKTNQVFEVSDFRSLTGSYTEGSSVCINQAIDDERAQEGRQRRSTSVEDQLNAIEEKLSVLDEQYNNDEISIAQYASQSRSLQIQKQQLLAQVKEIHIDNKNSKVNCNSSSDSMRFTVQTLCPPRCIDGPAGSKYYSLWEADNALNPY